MVAQGATPQPSPTVQPHPHTKCHQPTTAHTQGSHKATKPQQSEAPTTMLLPSHTHTGSGPTRQPHQKAHGDGDGVRQGTCTVCVLLATHQHSALLSSFLSCLLFLSLFHHHHPHSWGHQRERSGGKGERGRREVCHPKRHAKRQHKHSKKKTTPGVPTLSPTLVQTTPFHPSLHSSHHKSCFPLGMAVTVSPKAHTRFSHQHKR